jgi:uncharacterized protein (DUF433 family)
MTTTIDIGTLITTTPGLHGGCPHIVSKGITVRRIVTWYKRGLNAEEICDQIGIVTLAEVYAALAYYHANTEAIEADLAYEKAEADRLEKQQTEEPTEYPEVTTQELMMLAEQGGSFDFLYDEPDLYTFDDREPINW